MLTRIRNATLARQPRVEMPSSRLKVEIARILESEGYVQGFKVLDAGADGRAQALLRVFLKYGPRGERVITGLERVSRPGRRVYFGRDDVPDVLAGLGTSILTTSRGVMTGREAVKSRRRRRSALQRLVGSSAPRTSERATMSCQNRKETNRRAEGRQGRRQPGAVEVKGPKGSLRQALPAGIGFTLEGETLTAKTLRDDPQLGKFHGLARSLVANAVLGVTEGFRKDLDIVGVGYRAELKGKQVVFALGYSHPVVFDIPGGHRHRDRQADAHHRHRRRSPAGRPGGGEHPPDAQARSVQAEGRALHG